MSQTKVYQRRQVPAAGNPQESEAWALIEAARRMAAVIEFGNLRDLADRRKLREALRLNLRIWTIIQAEQAVGDNPLPTGMRQNILTLCKFIDQRTADVMTEPTPEKVVALIDINRNIAAGLLGSVSDEDLAAQAENSPAAPSEESDTSEEEPQPVRSSPLSVDI